MSEDCPFCGIVAGEIPGRIVHEDESAVAFLDVNPLAAGHTLVVPTAHRERITDLSAAEAAEVFQVVAEVTGAVEAAVDAAGTTVAVNDGEVAGQEVPHVHVHVVPRHSDDGVGALHSLFGEIQDVEDDEMDAIEADIREAM